MSMATGKGAQYSPADFIYARNHGPVFDKAPGNDELMEMVLALTAEVSILRDRLDTHERIAANGDLPTYDRVEDYEADEEATGFRARTRKRILDKVFRPLKVRLARLVAEKSES